MKYLILLLLLASCSRSSQTFTEQVKFEKGFVMPDGKTYMTIPTGTSTITWDLLQGKPVNFLPSAHTHLYSDIISNPAERSLVQVLESLDYLPVPRKTTLQINAMIVPVNRSGIVFDVTDTVYKAWDGKKWNVIH